MFLANITTIILIAPVTILICEILGLESRPFLFTEAMFSNLGGVATMVGDPPNIIIASASGFTFNDFPGECPPDGHRGESGQLLFYPPSFPQGIIAYRLIVRHLLSVQPREAIKDKRTVIKVLLVLLAAIIGFTLQSTLGVSPAFIAIVAAVIAVLWVAPDIKTDPQAFGMGCPDLLRSLVRPGGWIGSIRGSPRTGCLLPGHSKSSTGDHWV